MGELTGLKVTKFTESGGFLAAICNFKDFHGGASEYAIDDFKQPGDRVAVEKSSSRNPTLKAFNGHGQFKLLSMAAHRMCGSTKSPD